MEKVSFAKSYIKFFLKDFTANNIFFCLHVVLQQNYSNCKGKKEDRLTTKGRQQINKQETKIISVLDKISDDSRTFQ